MSIQAQLERILLMLKDKGPSHASGSKKPSLSQQESKISK